MSKSQIVRLIRDGAIEVDGKVVKDPFLVMEVYSIIKIGKKEFRKVIFYKGRFKDLIYDVLK